MRLTIFGRVILAQSALIVLIMSGSLYALAQLNALTRLNTKIVATEAASMAEAKRLLRTFLAQMRNAEKYVLLRDKVFYSYFSEGHSEFERIMEALAPRLDTAAERTLLAEIGGLHTRYANSLSTALTRKGTWEQEKTEISEGILSRTNELIRLREEAMAREMEAARDQASQAAKVLGWLTLGGISAAVLLAYFHARGVSRPLRKLAEELRSVGQGEFHRSLELRAPKEIQELAQDFNWMAARLVELDALKAEFLAHVSHELRTPLAALQEGTALLREEVAGPLTPAQRDIVAVLRSHSERLYRSIAAILDLSKLEAGMMEYVREPTELKPLIERSMETVRLLAQKKELQLDATGVAPALPQLPVDAERIQQVLDNLLSNAVKFTPEGGTIRLSAALKGRGDGHGGWVEVRVADTGAGIPAGEGERIFEKFYQSRRHRGQGQRGTGLGLAIARHIVDAHGGRIWVESREGQGATFVFRLPVSSDGRSAETGGADAA